MVGFIIILDNCPSLPYKKQASLSKKDSGFQLTIKLKLPEYSSRFRIPFDFVVDLLDENETVLLQLWLRKKEGRIILNAQDDDSAWGREEYGAIGESAFTGDCCSITISDRGGECFMVAPENCNQIKFRKRTVPVSAVRIVRLRNTGTGNDDTSKYVEEDDTSLIYVRMEEYAE